jgi:DnaK suppressor protein
MTTTTTVTTTDRGQLPEALLLRLRDRLFIECSQLAAENDAHRAALAELSGRSDRDSMMEYEHVSSAIVRCGDAIIETFQALLRLDAGVYGTCEDCGGAIAAARLEAMPRARECAECAPSPALRFG